MIAGRSRRSSDTPMRVGPTHGRGQRRTCAQRRATTSRRRAGRSRCSPTNSGSMRSPSGSRTSAASGAAGQAARRALPAIRAAWRRVARSWLSRAPRPPGTGLEGPALLPGKRDAPAVTGSPPTDATRVGCAACRSRRSRRSPPLTAASRRSRGRHPPAKTTRECTGRRPTQSQPRSRLLGVPHMHLGHIPPPSGLRSGATGCDDGHVEVEGHIRAMRRHQLEPRRRGVAQGPGWSECCTAISLSNVPPGGSRIDTAIGVRVITDSSPATH